MKYYEAKTLEQLIEIAHKKVIEYNENYDRDNLMYWRGVLRGLEDAENKIEGRS